MPLPLYMLLHLLYIKIIASVLVALVFFVSSEVKKSNSVFSKVPFELAPYSVSLEGVVSNVKYFFSCFGNMKKTLYADFEVFLPSHYEYFKGYSLNKGGLWYVDLYLSLILFVYSVIYKKGYSNFSAGIKDYFFVKVLNCFYSNYSLSPLYAVYLLSFSLFMFVFSLSFLYNSPKVLLFSFFSLLASLLKCYLDGVFSYEVIVGNSESTGSLAVVLYMVFDISMYVSLVASMVFFFFNPNYYTGFSSLGFYSMFSYFMMGTAFHVMFFTFLGMYFSLVFKVFKDLLDLFSSDCPSWNYSFESFGCMFWSVSFSYHGYWPFIFFIFLWFHFLFTVVFWDAYGLVDFMMEHMYSLSFIFFFLLPAIICFFSTSKWFI